MQLAWTGIEHPLMIHSIVLSVDPFGCTNLRKETHLSLYACIWHPCLIMLRIQATSARPCQAGALHRRVSRQEPSTSARQCQAGALHPRVSRQEPSTSARPCRSGALHRRVSRQEPSTSARSCQAGALHRRVGRQEPSTSARPCQAGALHRRVSRQEPSTSARPCQAKSQVFDISQLTSEFMILAPQRLSRPKG